MKLMSYIVASIIFLGAANVVFAANEFADGQRRTQAMPIPADQSAMSPKAQLIDDGDEDGWIFAGCTFAYSQQDCESWCAQYVNGGQAQASRCEQLLRCTGDSGNGWACMLLPNGN